MVLGTDKHTLIKENKFCYFMIETSATSNDSSQGNEDGQSNKIIAG